MRNQVSCFVAISAAVVVVGCSEAAPSTPSYTTTTAGTTGAGGSGSAATGSGSSSSSTSSSSGSSSGSAGSTTATTSAGPTTSVGAGGAGGGSTTTDTTSTTGGGGGGTGGTGGSTGTAGAGGSGGSGGAGTGGAGGGAPSGAITSVVKTAGCGSATAPPTGRQTIQTMGTKPAGCADGKCGAWSYTREYFVNLPAGYNANTANTLVFLGPGCGSGGTSVYSLNNPANTIRVGITPPPNDIIHATNPNQGCFDDKEGDDSVDWVLYENLWDKLAGQLCFDKNRVFAAGNSSGAWFANEVGCKYAGDPTHPIRGIMPNTGGLPNQPQYKPTCTTKPMAGMWSHEIGDTTNPFSGNIYAIDRAMAVNGCTMGNSYSTASFDPFPIPTAAGGMDMASCKKMRGCPEIYPLVVCPLPGTGHGSHDNVANYGFPVFLKLFSTGNLITQ